MSAQSFTQYYHHGRFRVAGGVLPDAIPAYRTYGELALFFRLAMEGNLIVRFSHRGVSLFRSFSGQFYMVGDGKVCLICAYMRSNRFSSSSSHGPFTGNGSQEVFHCYICFVFEWRGM